MLHSLGFDECFYYVLNVFSLTF